jgi:hypothetical protein
MLRLNAEHSAALKLERNTFAELSGELGWLRARKPCFDMALGLALGGWLEGRTQSKKASESRARARGERARENEQNFALSRRTQPQTAARATRLRRSALAGQEKERREP